MHLLDLSHWSASTTSHPADHGAACWYTMLQSVLPVSTYHGCLGSPNAVRVQKSPNILLGRDYTAKIADVGIARVLTESQVSTVTSTGEARGALPLLHTAIHQPCYCLLGPEGLSLAS